MSLYTDGSGVILLLSDVFGTCEHSGYNIMYLKVPNSEVSQIRELLEVSGMNIYLEKSYDKDSVTFFFDDKKLIQSSLEYQMQEEKKINRTFCLYYDTINYTLSDHPDLESTREGLAASNLRMAKLSLKLGRVLAF